MRDKWSSKLGFILAAAGSAVGLGNLWKFPYEAGSNGGSAFVLLYFIFLILIGIPLMLAALTLGRKTKKSVFGAYQSVDQRFSFVGALGVIGSFFLLAFYSAVGGWVLYYLKEALLNAFTTTNPDVLGLKFSELLNSPLELIMYQGFFMVLTTVIVLRGISAGIEKVSKIMMPALFIMIVIIAIRNLTLPGSFEGVKFLFAFDVSKINLDVIMNALGQVFFSLSIGIGTLVTYGSYLDKDDDLLSSSIIIPSIDTGIALLAGLATLPAVFAFGFEPTGGPGLMFITLPAVFASMPFGYLFSVIFFFLVFFAALTSSISMLEIPVSYFIDEKNTRRLPTTIVLAIVIMLLGIPAALSIGPTEAWKSFAVIGSINIFDVYDQFTSNVLLPTGGFLLSIFVGHVLGTDQAIEEIESSGVTFRLKGIWSILIQYIVPAFVGLIMLNSYYELLLTIIGK
ncbi:sodium-dependent transporter [Haloplasma contractile]|uniref:Na+-dependent transporters of the SNF family ral function prediction only protein n=1 Tax=Haloplasma contractile SSD-17B TaxID=1033810 RepID=U2EA26_9MOLU|nr:sodium-dependent transporter [Haloplasma contractile]ERJ11696.1 Na+-dependent transporters of the SNF family ral function prediction only protein [Haloplasma contractile SSD-17B]